MMSRANGSTCWSTRSRSGKAGSARTLLDLSDSANSEQTYARIQSTKAHDMIDSILALLDAIEKYERQILTEHSAQQEATFTHAYHYSAIDLVPLIGIALLAGVLMH